MGPSVTIVSPGFARAVSMMAVTACPLAAALRGGAYP
jgi:hypothetical protein